jgi:hypothetical protein
MYELVIENRDLLKIAYGLAIALICLIIVVKTNKLFKLSAHQGIRYFRNAFLFYAIAFIIRYIFGTHFFYQLLTSKYHFLISIPFEYFLVMAGFFLFYSLLWKKMDRRATSSLFNSKILLFHAIAILIVCFDFMWQTFFFMFASQIILFIFASVISYANYKKSKSTFKFSEFYFIAMILSLFAWILNAIASLVNWNIGILVDIYIINMIIFSLILYGVLTVTKNG